LPLFDFAVFPFSRFLVFPFSCFPFFLFYIHIISNIWFGCKKNN
jgi:hypothetical protein